jgi:hypothetical protein
MQINLSQHNAASSAARRPCRYARRIAAASRSGLRWSDIRVADTPDLVAATAVFGSPPSALVHSLLNFLLIALASVLISENAHQRGPVAFGLQLANDSFAGFALRQQYDGEADPRRELGLDICDIPLASCASGFAVSPARDLIRRHPPIQATMILRCPQTRGVGMTKALTGEPRSCERRWSQAACCSTIACPAG